MSGNYEQRDNRVQAIDSSLNMLKELQAKLNKQSPAKQNRQQPTSAKQPNYTYTHTRMRTQPYSFTQRSPNSNYYPQITQFTIQQKSSRPANLSSSSPHHNHNHNHQQAKAYSHSQPTMVQHNQNQFNNIKQIIKQNRKLKKYVNCLLTMNDYLKNQLVLRDQRYREDNKQNGNSVQLQLMRMEVQYLKELNRDKQLELKRSLHLANMAPQQSSKSKQKHKKSESIHIGQFIDKNKGHNRSSSVYQMSGTRYYQSSNNEQQIIAPKQVNNSRAIKSMQLKKHFNQPHQLPSKKSSSNKVNSNKKNSSKNQSMQQKNYEKAAKGFRKCRLCYM